MFRVTRSVVLTTLALCLRSANTIVAQTVSFTSTATLPIVTTPNDAVVGDFNNDGKPDLAVTIPGAQAVSILLGNGDGSFQPAVNSPSGPKGGQPTPWRLGVSTVTVPSTWWWRISLTVSPAYCLETGTVLSKRR
jgi:hypothetical protein